MRQVVYVSSVVRAVAVDTDEILATSRDNNARDGLSGLLYSDGKRFLQVLEGEGATLAKTLARIENDRRHRAIVILSDRTIDAREFGDWAMAHRSPADDAAAFIDRIAQLVAGASPSVRATFQGFVEARARA